jgi:site-specific recombinase XerD
MRILMDTGLRVSGLAGLRFDPDDEDRNDVFLTQRRLRIRLKGGDETWVPIGKKAAASVDRFPGSPADGHLRAACCRGCQRHDQSLSFLLRRSCRRCFR